MHSHGDEMATPKQIAKQFIQAGRPVLPDDAIEAFDDDEYEIEEDFTRCSDCGALGWPCCCEEHPYVALRKWMA